MTNSELNIKHNKELRDMLILRYAPIAIKMIENEDDIPERAIRPMRDMKKHMAICQAFALSRRDNKTIYMDKHSEWCWNPLIAFGFVECTEGMESFDIVCRCLGISDANAAREFFAKFPTLPLNKYKGVLITPLADCETEPDVVLIYCNGAQLRHLAWAVKNVTGNIISTQLDAIDSCAYSCVVPMKTGEYRVTLPDVGEYERAGAEENEIILSAPGARMEELLSGLRPFSERGMGFANLARSMEFEFARPAFYNELFGLWGLDQSEEWKR